MHRKFWTHKTGFPRRHLLNNNGNIWIGHTLGLSKINPQQKKFALYQTDASLPYNNLNNHFQRLHQRPDGSFFFFTRHTIYRSAYLGAPLEELNDIESAYAFIPPT